MQEKNLKAFQPRKHHRYKSRKTMQVCVKSVCGTVDTKDISEGGIALDMLSGNDLPELKVGSIVSVRPVDSDTELPKVGRVVRIDTSEAGIEYVC